MKFLICFALLIHFSYSQIWFVGSSSNSIVPTVNGRTDYVKDISENDHVGPGTFVLKFDVGKIKVGNGEYPANWVRDHLNVTVVTLRSPISKQSLVVVGINVYMIFKNDWEYFYEKVRKQLQGRFGELKFIAHADHNHHGPDTSGIDPLYPINDKYYEYMINVMVKTTVEAFTSEQRATLEYSESEWAFGMVKNRDPRVLDKGLRILQAKDEKKNIVATIVQWTNHPEVTLGFQPTVPTEDCQRIGTPNCSARNRYFTSDFVGVTQRILKERFKSNVCYLNGAVGVLVAPLRANVWEPSERFPITGDGGKMPEGATPLPGNFRKTFLIGRELANAIVRTIQKPKELESTDFIHKKVEFFTRMTNIAFRIGAAALRPGNRSLISYTPRKAYICTNHTYPTFATCKDDEFKNAPTQIPLVQMRLGEYFLTETVLVDFGALKILTAPAEIPPELFVGLPSDFLTNTSKYYLNPKFHAYGKDYIIPGFGKDVLKCNSSTSCWLVGLGGDELGYMVPISDIRYKCTFSEGECDKLPLTFKEVYSMSGMECRWIIENVEEARRRYGEKVTNLIYICTYGFIQQSQYHYEETNGLGWNLASDWIRAVKKLVE